MQNCSEQGRFFCLHKLVSKSSISIERRAETRFDHFAALLRPVIRTCIAICGPHCACNQRKHQDVYKMLQARPAINPRKTNSPAPSLCADTFRPPIGPYLGRIDLTLLLVQPVSVQGAGPPTVTQEHTPSEGEMMLMQRSPAVPSGTGSPELVGDAISYKQKKADQTQSHVRM